MNHLSVLADRLDSLIVFRHLLKDPVITRLRELLSHASNPGQAITLYAEFTYALFQQTDNLSEYLYAVVLESENFYMREKGAGKEISPIIEECLNRELDFLETLSNLRAADVKEAFAYDEFLPEWRNRSYSFATAYSERIENIHRFGYGIFAQYHVFTLTNGTLVPVKCPDPQTLAQLARYEREREPILQNTEVLLQGGYASNVLLYGDSGTGKSSTIKAIVNHYKDEGLRLIEVKKQELHRLPDLLESLSENPLKFILFIDDLSFMKNDDNFSSLKAILEGGVFAKSKNVAIYATSNRRHLVKENLSDRYGDDVHTNDTLQEITSLAARFGLTITFERPDKDSYLDIVRHLAMEYGLNPDSKQLIARAEAFALRNNGRSPRTAKQFIELQKAGL